MLKLFVSLSFIVCCISLQAQDFHYVDYDWAEVPEEVILSEKELLLDNVILKKKQVNHLVIIDEQPYEYRLLHQVIQLNTDAGIERYNKWHLSNYGAIEVTMQKSRVISPDGKITVQNKKDIKEYLDENGDVEYKYFAFEGLTKGSKVEILELVLYPPRLTGGSYTIQGSEVKKNVDIEIITPAFLVYKTHPINGCKEFELDSTETEVRKMTLHYDHVDAVKEEDWSTYGANLMKVYYKFNRNLNSNKANFYSYTEVTRNIHAAIFAQPAKKQLTELKKYIKTLKLDGLSTEQKIRAVENDVKKNFYIIDGTIENGNDLSFMFKNHVMDDNGFYIMMVNIFRLLEIPTDLVVTCDRYDNTFLTDYEAYNFLEEYLLYFPNEDKYLSYHLFNRYGYIPVAYIDQKGLFIREKQLGDIAVGVGKVEYIATPKAEESVDEINVKATIDVDAATCSIDIERIGTGYKAQPYQIPWDYLDEKQIEELKEEFIGYIDNDATLETMEFTHPETTSFGVHPFAAKASFTSANFTERGGNKLLLKAGMMIGPQAELYNRDPRVSPIAGPFPRFYNRTIKIEIPAGYTVKNATDLNMNIVPFGTDGSIGFVSNYKIEGNELLVTISEWYKEVHYPASDYSKYESVINGAADFNKIVLILEPTN